ncbi:MAG TPA: hypothetical protein VK081_12950 [Planctomycetota bacterium]|nr:hypothetical protein [Planctomycetota bacterium]
MRLSVSANALAAALLLALLAGCAVLKERNRRTLNLIDGVAPGSPTLRWAALPVTLPLGVGALVADAAVVHPIAAIDDAWGDMTEWLWETHEESLLRAVAMTPLRVLATPPVFALRWATRALFPVEPREKPRRAAKEGDA